MKTEELMIGDWVNLNFDVDYKTGESIYAPVQVTGINKDGTIDVNCTFDKSESMQDGWDLKLIEPIPLTSEILEKNGFRRKGTDFLIKGFLYWSSFAKRIFVQGHPDQIDWIDVCECQYVHELQHLLKQYKIEKKIIL